MIKHLVFVAMAASVLVQDGHSRTSSDIHFGAIIDGQFRETKRVPNLVGQSYGWVASADPSRPVRWTERFTLPDAPETWGPGESDSNVKISADRRTATTFGESTSGDREVWHFWGIAEGDPDGMYRMVISLSDGRTAEFEFEITSEPIVTDRTLAAAQAP